MTAPIDVLAVLSRHVSLAEQFACVEQRAEAHAVFDAVHDLIQAAKLAERIIQSNLSGSGYEAGSCTDQWCPEIREQVAALPFIAAALANVSGGAK